LKYGESAFHFRNKETNLFIICVKLLNFNMLKCVKNKISFFTEQWLIYTFALT